MASPTLSDTLRAVVSGHLGGAEGTVSIWCADLAGRVGVAHDADATHYAASTMKLPLLAAAYRLHERGVLDLDRPVLVHDEFASALDGSVFRLERDDDQDDETWALLGGQASLRGLVRHAIVRSGNLATNLVLETIGIREVAAVLTDAGCTSTTVLPRGIGDAAAREAGLDNLVTAADLGRVMTGVAAGTLATGRTCAEMEAVLAAQEHREMIPAGLPPGTYVANKTGWVDGVTHDVGLVRPGHGEPYVLAVCTTVDVPEQVAHDLVAGISRAVWQERVG